MDTQIYNYIKFVHFMNVQEWSVQFTRHKLKSKMVYCTKDRQ
jgi:hypothetical protein